MHATRPALPIILLTLAVATALTACGRRSGLDTPFEAQTEARREAQRAGTGDVPPEPTPPVRDRRFILDGLIE